MNNIKNKAIKNSYLKKDSSSVIFLQNLSFSTFIKSE